jgi:hypothetical protein
MKPAWAEVKEAIREIVCPSFLPLGFTNPGISMWRCREQIVDVVHFYYNGNMPGFAIELGCHPRKAKPSMPKPWDCIFRTRISHSDRSICQHTIFLFAGTIEIQRQILLRLVPEISIKTSAWLSQLDTLSDAIQLITNSSPSELHNLMDAGKGSQAYEENLRLLQSLVSAYDPE